MQLTKFTDYSLRVLLAVGANAERGTTIADISTQYGISKNHLMKVVQQLAALGYLETVRGRGGGLYLSRAPREINIGRLVRETEGMFALVPCFTKARDDVCVISRACILKGVLSRALDAFLAVLDAHTLEDLLGSGRQLRRLLDHGAKRPATARAS